MPGCQATHLTGSCTLPLVASQPSSDTVDSSPFQGHGPLTHQVPARPPAVIVYATSFFLRFRVTINWDRKWNMTDEQKWFYEHIKFTRPRYVMVVFSCLFCFFCGASVRFWTRDYPIAAVWRQIRLYFSRISAPSLTFRRLMSTIVNVPQR